MSDQITITNVSLPIHSIRPGQIHILDVNEYDDAFKTMDKINTLYLSHETRSEASKEIAQLGLYDKMLNHVSSSIGFIRISLLSKDIPELSLVDYESIMTLNNGLGSHVEDINGGLGYTKEPSDNEYILNIHNEKKPFTLTYESNALYATPSLDLNIIFSDVLRVLNNTELPKGKAKHTVKVEYYFDNNVWNARVIEVIVGDVAVIR